MDLLLGRQAQAPQPRAAAPRGGAAWARSRRAHARPRAYLREERGPVEASQAARPLGLAGRDDADVIAVTGVALETAPSRPPSRRAIAPTDLRDAGPLRVAVDVDEVLGRFLASLNAYVLEAHAERYAVADYSEYNFARVWGCSQDESNARVHAFFGSRHFAAGIEPVAGAAAALAALRAAAGAELVVVTSRQHVIRAPTLEWLDRHFEGLFSDVHFGNHWAVAGPPPRSKAAMCAAAGAHVLVDDNPGYALECAEAGIEVLLFDWAGEPGGYPWARTAGGGPRHARVARVRDWAQAGAALAALAAERAAR